MSTLGHHPLRMVDVGMTLRGERGSSAWGTERGTGRSHKAIPPARARVIAAEPASRLRRADGESRPHSTQTKARGHRRALVSEPVTAVKRAQRAPKKKRLVLD